MFNIDEYSEVQKKKVLLKNYSLFIIFQIVYDLDFI